MTVLRTVRVAAVQATPVVLDVDATLEKTVALIGEAAGQTAPSSSSSPSASSRFTPRGRGPATR